MQAEYQDLNCTRASDMSELNVMDFVETEYKSDVEDILLDKKPRRKGQRKSKLSIQYEYDDYEDGSKVSNYPRKSRKCLQRKRRRSSMKSKSVHDSVDSDNHFYPYATLMKVLCDEVGKKNVIEEPRTGKLFKQLSHANLCYPYATFLQELHEIANEGFGSISPSVENGFVNPSESEVSQVMKSFRFKSSTLRLGVSDQSEDSGKDDFKRTFSTLLLDLVNEHKLQDQSHKGDRTVLGIGKILKICMSDVPGTKPAEELSFSALLQGLSLLAERVNTCDSESESVNQVLEESSESSLEEEEEEWRPSFCRQLDGIPDAQREHKKKSLRRKKPVSRFDPTPGKSQSSRVKNKQHTQSSSSSQSLLQLILNNGSEETVQKVRNKKAKKSLLRSEVLEKIKDKINSRKAFTDASTDSNENVKEDFGNEESLSEGSLEEQRNFYGAIAAKKRERSLLKEYLLKPTDEEITSKSYADIPIMSGNSFVFSKLLQNFKMGSDNHLIDSYHENLEDNFSSSILRKMLIEKGKPLPNSASDDEARDVEDFKPIEHLDLSSLQSFLCENNSEEEFPSYAVKQEFENKNDNLGEKLRERIAQALDGSDSNLRNCIKKEDKSDNDVSNCLDLSVLESCSSSDPTDLNPVCKIKCEVKCEEEFMGEVRECDICHTEFSSSVDFNNHEMLFHCGKEAEPQSSGPTCALPHGSDILQTGLFQEKLPA